MNIAEILNEAGYLSHGYCLLWQPWLVALHAVPDLLIFLAYTSIPLTLLRLLRRRPDLAEYRGLIVLFASFILLCGLTHLVGLVTLWLPIYPVHGTLKAVTAIVSVVTALTLVPLVPQLANLPTPTQLRSLNTRLWAEVRSHEETLGRLEKAKKTLESRIAERTDELTVSNDRLRVMARESVHRSNNMLTQIQSLARQTAPKTEEGRTWLASFDARVAAIARATELVLKSGPGWTVEVATIVAAEVAELPGERRDNLRVEGPDLKVRTEAAQQLALLIHELLTVSQARGALSVPTGDAILSWRVEDEFLVLDWTEENGPAWPNDLDPLSIEKRLLVQSIPMTLGGTGGFDPDRRVAYVLRAPVERLKPHDRTEPIDLVTQAYPRTPSRLANPAQSE